jgi:hypothetical protein
MAISRRRVGRAQLSAPDATERHRLRCVQSRRGIGDSGRGHLYSCSPASAKTRPDPATRSLTVEETRTCDGPASATTRAPTWTSEPRTLSLSSSISPAARSDLDPEGSNRMLFAALLAYLPPAQLDVWVGPAEGRPADLRGVRREAVEPRLGLGPAGLLEPANVAAILLQAAFSRRSPAHASPHRPPPSGS